jgi:hypothetical protein
MVRGKRDKWCPTMGLGTGDVACPAASPMGECRGETA